MDNSESILPTEETSTTSLWDEVRMLKSKMPSQPGDGPTYDHATSPPPQPAVSACESSLLSSPARSSHADLIGQEDDVLLPSTAAIARVFAGGRTYWASLVDEALSMKGWPRGLADPSIVLEDTPALPDVLPTSKYFAGQCAWRVSGPGYSDCGDVRCGRQQLWTLSYDKPMTCLVSHAPVQDDTNPGTARGVSVLTLGWAYILSARLLESQGRSFRYSKLLNQPLAMRKDSGRPATIHVGPWVSERLVRWICALLAPGMGWEPEDRKGLPPWAVCCDKAPVSIFTQKPFNFSQTEAAPGHKEALELLVELGRVYHLKPASPDALCPYAAGLMAALALPFYKIQALQPRLYFGHLEHQPGEAGKGTTVRSMAAHLRYYMPLSMQPSFLGPVIWSVFWQLEVECNLVSPWLASIHDVLKAYIEMKNLSLLGKIFALRRPRIGWWWMGIFLLGDVSILDQVVRYLKTSLERWGHASFATPDLVAAAWTGSPQSFLEEEASPTPDADADVSRANILRIRHNFRLQEDIRLLSWKPFGTIERNYVELEIWPFLASPPRRQYEGWTWTNLPIDRGFRKETGLGRENAEEGKGAVFPEHCPVPNDLAVCLAPSKRATYKMVGDCALAVNGDRDLESAGDSELKNHPWLEDWR